MSGDCFEVAGRLVIENPHWTLCHGIAIGDGTANFGRRHWHAWCEYDEVIALPPVDERPEELRDLADPTLIYVVDRSNGKDILIPAAIYYNVGRIDEVWYYSRKDAAVHMLAEGHWGPWVEVADVL